MSRTPRAVRHLIVAADIGTAAAVGVIELDERVGVADGVGQTGR
jgi:hypothetical protein